MNNMRRGFTMIELVFVIVIIGILAAVALPKMTATRDDAKISQIVANARTALGDFSTAYTGMGRQNFAAADFPDITNIPFKAACGNAGPILTGTTVGGVTAVLCDGSVECLRFVIDANATQVAITPTNSTNQISPVCTGVFADIVTQSIAGGVSGTAKVHTFGGNTITRN